MYAVIIFLKLINIFHSIESLMGELIKIRINLLLNLSTKGLGLNIRNVNNIIYIVIKFKN